MFQGSRPPIFFGIQENQLLILASQLMSCINSDVLYRIEPYSSLLSNERNRYLPSLGHCIWETSLLQILSCTLTNIPPCLVLKRQPGFLYHLLCLNLNLFTHFDGAQMSVWEIISLVLFVHLWEYLYLTSCWMNSFNRHGILLGKQFPFRVWSYCPIFFVILEKVCFDLWMFCSSYWGFRIFFHFSVRFWIFSVLYCGVDLFSSIVFGPQWSLSICSLTL